MRTTFAGSSLTQGGPTREELRNPIRFRGWWQALVRTHLSDVHMGRWQPATVWTGHACRGPSAASLMRHCIMDLPESGQGPIGLMFNVIRYRLFV